MAYIRKKNGSWEYTVTAGKNPVTGKYERITKSGFRLKREAEEAAKKVEYELNEGSYVKETNTTFSDFVEIWLSHYETQVKVSSVRARKIAAKRLLDVWEHYTIGNISMSMYQEHINDLSTQFSKNYIESIHSTGRMIFNHAEKHKFIKHNPTKHFEMPRMRNDVVTEDVKELKGFLEAEELTEFLLLVKEHGLRNDLAIFTTLALSGMRVGELLALKQSDIDMNTNEISISKTYYNPNNNKKEYTLLTPKTDGSVRKIDIDPHVMQTLREMVKQQKEEMMKNRKVYHDEGFLFTDVQGYPMPIKLVATRLQRLMKLFYKDVEEEQRKHITPHSFRHTYISLSIEANVSVEVIQKMVGHTDIATTMNIYAHMTKNTKKQASHMLSSHLAGMTKKLQET